MLGSRRLSGDLALIQKYNHQGRGIYLIPHGAEFNQCYDEAAFQRVAARYPKRPPSLYVHIPSAMLCYFLRCNSW